VVAFVVGGFAAFVGTLGFSAGGFRALRGDRGYQATLQFRNACGLIPGSAVRIRGVPIGRVVAVTPTLRNVDVTIEVDEVHTVIPRNSQVQANQSGLIAVTEVEITPQLPLEPHQYSPLDRRCDEEGVVLCHRGSMPGEPGVVLDDLIFILTKLTSQMDIDGYSRMMATAEETQKALQEARPLIYQASRLVREFIPLVKDLRDGELVRSIESLSATAATAAFEIHALSKDVFTPDNVALLRESVQTLATTLRNVESVSNDMARSANDKQVQASVRQLVAALNRLLRE
jgi:phospholipid/cholesterol/gamma-HCH transport system substrate-binding protein